MIHFSLSSYLTVHKRNEEICFRDMPTRYRVFGLSDINPINKINKISFKKPLIIYKHSAVLQTFYLMQFLKPSICASSSIFKDVSSNQDSPIASLLNLVNAPLVEYLIHWFLYFACFTIGNK